MSWKPLLATFLLLGALVPSVQGVSISPPDATTTLAAEGTTALSFNVTASCDEFVPDAITGQGTVEYTVTATALPAWLNASEATVAFDATGCLTNPTGSLQESGSIDLTTAAGAPGMAPTAITLEADEGAATADADVQVEYVKGYMLMFPADAFPMEVGAEATTFNATVHLFANARSMAMFQVLERPEYLSVSGIPDFKTVGDEELAGDMEFMQDYPITVTPPTTGTWEEDSITFKTWSHFLDDGNVKTEDETITWTFVNTAPAQTGGDDSNDSPGGGVVLVGLGLLGAAFVALRRRK